MADAAILKKNEQLQYLVTDWLIFTKLDMVMRLYPPDPLSE